MKIAVWIDTDNLEALKEQRYSEVCFWEREPHDMFTAVQVLVDYDTFVKLLDSKTSGLK